MSSNAMTAAPAIRLLSGADDAAAPDVRQAPSSRATRSSVQAVEAGLRFFHGFRFSWPAPPGHRDRLHSRRGKAHADVQGVFPCPGGQGRRQPVGQRLGRTRREGHSRGIVPQSPRLYGGGGLGRRLAAVPAPARRELGWLSTNPFGSNFECCEAQALIQKKKYVNLFI